MRTELFREVVSRDVRGRLDVGRRHELRRVACRERWLDALHELHDDATAQIAAGGGDERWRSRVTAYRRVIEQRICEAERLPLEEDDPDARVAELEAAITAHRDHVCDDACDDVCPADLELWATVERRPR